MYPKRESLRFCKHCPATLDEDENRKWHGFCRLCARYAMDHFVITLLNQYTEDERKLLNDCFDGVGLDEPEKARLPE